jgi:yecA family protein
MPLPPKVSELGHQPFTAAARTLLAKLLQHRAWPKETMDIDGLEGYLVALLSWPVELQPGAWLPPIWNQTGWKIPPPIETTEAYQEFLEFVVAYLRELDAGLLADPPAFSTRLPAPLRDSRSATAPGVQSWARGFGRGLLQAAQLRVEPDFETREAVRSIAAYAGERGRGEQVTVRQAHAELQHAVLVLAAKRRSRGPLGLFAKQPDAVKGTP